MKPILILILSVSLVAMIAPAAENPNDLFQQALVKERAEGNLPEAIKLYQRIVDKYASNHKVAAQALLQLAECQTKLGDAQARKSLERLVRDFSDQTETVATARLRMAAMGGAKTGVSYRQVWAGPKVDTLGAVSPDGRYLSYVDWDTGDLALHDFVANTDRRLTNKGTWAQSDDFAEESTISGDGKQVAYSWYSEKEDRYELRIAGLQTSGFAQPRRLFDSGDITWIAPYDWSPDGKWLAVELMRKDGTEQIGLVSTQDSSLRVLKSGVVANPTRLFFSPDGRYLGFDLQAGGNNDRDLFFLAVDGSGETKAVAGPSQNVMMGWSPDGKRLLFTSDRAGSIGLWAVSMADGKPQGTPELIRPDIPPFSLGVTTSGSLYLGARLSDQDIHVASLDFNTGKLLSPPARPVQTYIGSNSQPDWSPDGEYLAYVSTHNPVGGDRVLAIRSLETGQVRELRPSLRAFNWLRWSPDGRSFIAQGRDFQGRQGVYRIDAETGEAVPIAVRSPGGGFQLPQWSPDGKRIYYLSSIVDTAEQALIERDLGAGTERELIRRKFLGTPAVLPDGRHIAIRGSDLPSKGWSVLLIPAAGGEPRELLRVNAPESVTMALTCTPDGRGIIVRKMLSHSNELWLVPVGDGQPRRLDIDSNPSSPIRVHPDGRRIAYMAGEVKREVWVLENFLPVRAAR